MTGLLHDLECHKDIKPLPPIFESALEPQVKLDVNLAVQKVLNCASFEVFTLYRKCGAIKVGQFVVGSKSSRFNTVSIVKLFTINRERLAEVQFFCKCKVKCNGICKDIWLAAVCFFPEHQCKMWLGRPSEVWALSEFHNRVAFTKGSVNFGRYIGTDNVVIVSPLS